jgi:hypothetical protein
MPNPGSLITHTHMLARSHARARAHTHTHALDFPGLTDANARLANVEKLVSSLTAADMHVPFPRVASSGGVGPPATAPPEATSNAPDAPVSRLAAAASGLGRPMMAESVGGLRHREAGDVGAGGAVLVPGAAACHESHLNQQAQIAGVVRELSVISAKMGRQADTIEARLDLHANTAQAELQETCQLLKQVCVCICARACAHMGVCVALHVCVFVHA